MYNTGDIYVLVLRYSNCWLLICLLFVSFFRKGFAFQKLKENQKTKMKENKNLKLDFLKFVTSSCWWKDKVGFPPFSPSKERWERWEYALKLASASVFPYQQLLSPKREMFQHSWHHIVWQSAVYDSPSCLFSILRKHLVRIGYFDPGSDRDSGLNWPERKQDMSRPQP